RPQGGTRCRASPPRRRRERALRRAGRRAPGTGLVGGPADACADGSAGGDRARCRAGWAAARGATRRLGPAYARARVAAEHSASGGLLPARAAAAAAATQRAKRAPAATRADDLDRHPVAEPGALPSPYA